MELWEILVPTTNNSGKPIRVRQHRVWDSKVRAIAGGLTIFSPAKGEWIAPEGTLFRERMIPVRVRCTQAQIEKIMQLTLEFYQQKAVMAYRVSDRCLLLEAPLNSVRY